jgi:hypothetical protein
MMGNMFKVLTKFSKIIFFSALIFGTLGAYLEGIYFHPYMTYSVDICLVLCTVGLIFWPSK